MEGGVDSALRLHRTLGERERERKIERETHTQSGEIRGEGRDTGTRTGTYTQMLHLPSGDLPSEKN